mmetsp:Transcript_26312/g.75963  ORF Transcript_26312/g.75963 Transcript_26312/m.75963 type:complete len:123 (-) Transcript_26312:336-704(-)
MIERKQILCVVAALIANMSTSDAFIMVANAKHHVSTTTASTDLQFGPNTAYQEKSSNVKQATTVHLDHMREDTAGDIMADAEFMNALEHAKQMDREYGVWSTPSKSAWEEVDSIFARKSLRP